MAVQAQYPSNILLLNRNVQDSKNIILGTNDYSLGPSGEGFIDQSHILFNDGGGVNPRKRSREIGATTTNNTTTTTVYSFNFCHKNNQQQNHNNNNELINLSQLQNNQQQPSVVSTGLKLSFGNHNQNHHQHLFSDEFALQFKQQSDELDYFLHAQGEQFRRTLAEKTQRHYNVLLRSAEEAATRQIREKEVELDTAIRRNAELETRAAQLTSEAQAWQARAQAQEAQAVSLQAQIQQAMVGPSTIGATLQHDREGSGLNCTGDADDAESVYIDPRSDTQNKSPSCKACRTRVASVVLLPCRHMCVCVQCDDRVQACPVCFSLRSASVEVYLS